MLKSLSIRNAKRQAKDYLIYFITLVLSVSLMFGLNSLIFSGDILSAIENITSMRYTIIITSMIIVLILAWLARYMMNFMLKKRSKELSIYMVLGIENKEVVRMFLTENLLIGAIALLVGYLGGIFIFQVLKAIVMNLIGLEYNLSFDFSFQAIVLTALYFVLIYMMSILRSSRTIRKLKLYELLYYDKLNEKSSITQNWKRTLVFCVSLLCLASALYLFLETPLGEGLDFPIGILCIAAFIYCFFISLPNFVVTVLGTGKWKFKGTRAIMLRNFTSKVSSMSKTMGFLSILFMISLFLISVGMIQIATFNHRVNLVPFDFSIISENGIDNLQEYQDYVNENFDVKDEHIYNIYQSDITEYTDLNFAFTGYNYTPSDNGTHDLCISYSNYSRLREMLGYEPVTMAGNAFLIHCLSYVYPDIESHAENNPAIDVNGYELNLSGIYTEDFDQYDGFSNGRFFILVVPDFAVSDMEILYTKYSVITNGAISYSQYQTFLNEFDTLTAFRFDSYSSYSQGAGQTAILDAKTAIQRSNGVMYSKGALPMWYIALILCVTGVTILVSNILIDEAKYKRQFDLLRNIGYSRSKLDNIILIQLAILFVVPAIPPIILNCVLSPIYAKYFGADVFVPHSDLWYNILLAYAVYLVIYLIYYIASYILLRRNVLTSKMI